MKIDANRLGLAAGITVGCMYGIFATLLKLWPAQVLTFIGTTHFISGLEVFAPFIKISLFMIIAGTISHMILVFLLFWVIATLYNKLQSE